MASNLIAMASILYPPAPGLLDVRTGRPAAIKAPGKFGPVEARCSCSQLGQAISSSPHSLITSRQQTSWHSCRPQWSFPGSSSTSNWQKGHVDHTIYICKFLGPQRPVMGRALNFHAVQDRHGSQCRIAQTFRATRGPARQTAFGAANISAIKCEGDKAPLAHQSVLPTSDTELGAAALNSLEYFSKV